MFQVYLPLGFLYFWQGNIVLGLFWVAPIAFPRRNSLDEPLRWKMEMKINLNKQTSSMTELELAKANRIPNLSVTLGPDLVTNNSVNKTNKHLSPVKQMP